MGKATTDPLEEEEFCVEPKGLGSILGIGVMKQDVFEKLWDCKDLLYGRCHRRKLMARLQETLVEERLKYGVENKRVRD